MTNTFNRNSFSFPPTPALYEWGQLFGKCINQLIRRYQQLCIQLSFDIQNWKKGKFLCLSCLDMPCLLILIKGRNILEILRRKNSKMIIIMVGKSSLMLYCQCDKCSSESEIRGDSYQSGGAGGLNRDSDTCYQECGGSITSEKEQIKKLFSCSRCASIVC